MLCLSTQSVAHASRGVMLTARKNLCWTNKISRLLLHKKLSSSSESSSATKRRQKLLDVYAPFHKLDKGSHEYDELAISGRVWEDFFEPWNSEKLGYLSLQNAHNDLLQEIDSYRDVLSVPVSKISKTLVAEYAHQSVAIEGNRLEVGDSVIIADKLAETIFDGVDVATMPMSDLLSLSIPDTLVNNDNTNEVRELTNHIIASFWIAEHAANRLGSAGLSEIEIRQLSNLTNRGTDSEKLYTMGWGKRITRGDYRSTPIQTKSNPLRIYPYHIEVPALMRRFMNWRNQVHEEKRLHPLIAACQGLAYFLHIHPFPDGNGRVGRMIMHDYMIRQGYAPVVMQALISEDYLSMISDAQDGKPEEFVLKVLLTQLDELRTFKYREISTTGSP